MNILWIDTETGGLDANEHSLLQVGLVAMVNGEVVGEMELGLSLPTYHVQADAMAINQINLVKLYNTGYEPEQIVRIIKAFISSNFGYPRPLPVIGGHNVSLDHVMLRNLFKSRGQNLDEHTNFRTIDTCGLLLTLINMGLIPADCYKLDNALEFFKISVDHHKRHGALYDAKVTADLFLEIQSFIVNHGIES